MRSQHAEHIKDVCGVAPQPPFPSIIRFAFSGFCRTLANVSYIDRIPGWKDLVKRFLLGDLVNQMDDISVGKAAAAMIIFTWAFVETEANRTCIACCSRSPSLFFAILPLSDGCVSHFFLWEKGSFPAGVLYIKSQTLLGCHRSVGVKSQVSHFWPGVTFFPRASKRRFF